VTRDPDALARACAEAMWQEDRASRGLGMELLSVGPGRAKLSMTVTESMVNGHGIR
jgi:acyl-CoA thioesterase